MPNARLLNYLHLHFIVFIWGFTAVLGKLITINAISIVWWRMSIATIAIGLFMILRKRSLFPKSISRKIILYYIGAGVLIGLHWITFFGAIKVSNVSVCLAMMSTGALFTAVLEPIITGRTFILYEVLFGSIIVGTLLYVFSVEGDYWLGVILALISACLSAVFSIINGSWAKKESAVLISFWELLGGTVFIGLIITFFSPLLDMGSEFSIASSSVFTSMDWVWISVLAIICTAYAFIASIHVMKWLSPFTVMLTINLEPVYGIVLAFAIFGKSEEMTPTFYLGAIVILAVIILNGILKTRRKPIK